MAQALAPVSTGEGTDQMNEAQIKTMTPEQAKVVSNRIGMTYIHSCFVKEKTVVFHILFDNWDYPKAFADDAWNEWGLKHVSNGPRGIGGCERIFECPREQEGRQVADWEQLPEVKDVRQAMNALRLAVDSSVADDVAQRVWKAFIAIKDFD